MLSNLYAYMKKISYKQKTNKYPLDIIELNLVLIHFIVSNLSVSRKKELILLPNSNLVE